jgi:hypothetical protein
MLALDLSTWNESPRDVDRLVTVMNESLARLSRLIQ